MKINVTDSHRKIALNKKGSINSNPIENKEKDTNVKSPK